MKRKHPKFAYAFTVCRDTAQWSTCLYLRYSATNIINKTITCSLLPTGAQNIDVQITKFGSSSKITNLFCLLSVCVLYFDCICADISQLIIVLAPEWNIKLQISLEDFYRYHMTNTVYLGLTAISKNSVPNSVPVISLQNQLKKKKGESTLKLHTNSSHSWQSIHFRDRLYLWLKYIHNCHDVCW